jgi:hypothetical protein
MLEFNTDYLKFDAISIKERIIQLLSENTTFTDQVFEDSNLTTLIDVFSHSFEVLMYYLNNAASESMFPDAKMYENINRIVKLLGYNPSGSIAAKTTVTFKTKGKLFNELIRYLPKYTYVDTGLVDNTGNAVYYSTVNTIDIEQEIPETAETKVTMVNGRWNVYDKTFVATGEVLETFTLSLIDINNLDKPRFIAHPYIDVYVKRYNAENEEYQYIEYRGISDGTLFGRGTSLFGPDDNVFELRLNENKVYTLKFGDGIHGSKLQKHDELYIVYLESNGPDGKIGANIINGENTLDYGVNGLEKSFVQELLGIESEDIIPQDKLDDGTLYAENIKASTTPMAIESVDSIKKNSPNWFRAGGRLVTARDYRNYINKTYKNDLYDCWVMNNWEYMASFHKWLYDHNKLSTDIRTLYYKYADSCDFNNVYIWTKFKHDVDFDYILDDINDKKTLTAEPVIINAINTFFVPAFKNNNYDIDEFDPDVENWIEILRDKNSIVPVEKIKKVVIDTIKNYFDPSKFILGQIINISELNTKIMSVDGVSKVRTVFVPKGHSTGSSEYFNGLRFAYWTKEILNGSDLTISSGNVELEKFQFPTLLDVDLEKRVKVVFDTSGQPSIEF